MSVELMCEIDWPVCAMYRNKASLIWMQPVKLLITAALIYYAVGRSVSFSTFVSSLPFLGEQVGGEDSRFQNVNMPLLGIVGWAV